MTTNEQKALMLDKISILAYIHHSAKLHKNKLGEARWLARLKEASNIATMLEILTDEEIYAAIKSGEAEREKDE